MKIKLELRHLLDSEILTLHKNIYTSIATNVLVPAPSPTPAVMATDQITAETAIDNMAKGQIVQDGLVSIAEAALAKIRQNITAQGSTVQTRLDLTGDPNCAINSAIPLQSAPVRTTTMPVPTGCSASTGDLAGEIDWHCNAVSKAKYVLVETCIGDPNVEANWKPAKGSTKSSGSVAGFPSATVVWLRLAAEGPHDLTSGWSTPFMGATGI